jgi:glycosyltransferase involved in cell wall biosynthesis
VFVPNPIEPVFFEKERPDPARRVIYLGGARHIKGPDLIASAWPAIVAGHPDARLLMYGFSEADVARFGLPDVEDQPSVEVHGPVDKYEVARILAGGGVVVVPSRYEVSPVVVPEAWAVGLPVVATRVGGVPALAGDAAITVPTNADALADAVVRVLTSSEEADALVDRGTERAEEFRPDVVAEAYAREYEVLQGA